MITVVTGALTKPWKCESENGDLQLTWEFRKCFLEDVMFDLSNHFCNSLASPNLIVKFMVRYPFTPLLCPTSTEESPAFFISRAAPLSLSALLIKAVCVHCRPAEKPVHQRVGRVREVWRPHCQWECAVSIAYCPCLVFYLLLL